jgi:hypothetical protein
MGLVPLKFSGLSLWNGLARLMCVHKSGQENTFDSHDFNARLRRIVFALAGVY